MFKFRVTMSSIQLYEAIIEAEDADEARAIALEMDGGDFTEVEGTGDWAFHDAVWSEPEREKRVIQADGWTLVNDKGVPVVESDRVTTSKHVVYTVVGGAPPKHEASTGRVYLNDWDSYYPSVVNLKWVRSDTLETPSEAS